MAVATVSGRSRVVEKELRKCVKGEVRAGNDALGSYAYDGSIYRQTPLLIVIPKDAQDVARALTVCHRHGLPVTPRGCGTSLAGQTVNAAVVFDFSKYMNRILELDPERRIARVQPGVICDSLRQVAEKHHLTYGPDPATHDHATFGGMIGNNSCGVHSVMAGKTSENVVELDVLLYEGLRLKVGRTSEEEYERILVEGGRRAEVYRALHDLGYRYADQIRRRFPKIPRRVSGYNLEELLPENGFNLAAALVGTEGTCALVLEATIKLVPSPQQRTLVVLGYPDPPAAGRAAPEILPHKPIGLEHFDRSIISGLHEKGLHERGEELLPDGEAWLLVEFGADRKEDTDGAARRLMEDLKARPDAPLDMKLYADKKEEQQVWDVRENGVGASRIPPGHPGWPGWEDAAVPPERMGDYLADFIELCKKHGYSPTFFGHVGQGCVHTRMNWDLRSADGVASMRRFMDEAADVVVEYGGSLSGEHGDGQKLAELLPKMFGTELMGAFAEFKAIWDPNRRMNPGKVVSAYRLDQNLREGPAFQLHTPSTRFSFNDDQGSFAEAAGRCFGVGKCRHLTGGTMCPSFMVTREEIHSTRGRARLLNEMMTSVNPRQNPWRDEAVKEALDLCLACKGCKGDCPVQVDMATYKAEFLSHYFEGRLRPRTAYAMGLIMYWSRLAEWMPRMTNFATHAPLISRLGKALAGVSQSRRVPSFAHKTFKRWWIERGGTRNPDAPPVILWPDTFNDHFHPETLIAGAEVLEAAGFQVKVPKPALCCGRPLYDYGMLDLAKRMLATLVEELRPDIRAGTRLVGLEPSCVAVFRDELSNLFPHDQDARRLAKQSLGIAEFLKQEAPGFEVPPLGDRKALFHGHCHQKAIWGTDAEIALLQKLGLDLETPDSGCCGLAGSFGYEAGEKAKVADLAGELVLAPAVRNSPEHTLVVAEGFSCRSQIEHLTDRRGLHIAEILHLALSQGKVPVEGRPEDRYRETIGKPPAGSPVGLASAAAVAAIILGAGIALGRFKRSPRSSKQRWSSS